MQIIVDCGATKATWCLAENGMVSEIIQTKGFNPNYSGADVLRAAVSSLSDYSHSVDEVFFYGTGCSTEVNKVAVNAVLKEFFPTQYIDVQSDILASARALLNHDAGLACILGTGSNACLYDGNCIVKTFNSLGYALGDEGSGFDIGKNILKAYFYNQMPDVLRIEFENEYSVTRSYVLDKVYSGAGASRYVASFVRFAANHLDDDFVKHLCSSCFDSFIAALTSQFDTVRFKRVCASGSVAYFFTDLLRERLSLHGIELGNVLQNPIDGLVGYHKKGPVF